MDEGMEHHMDANEQNDIKPAEYQELSDFKEAPGYIPALDPISNFESFENYGADDLQEPHEGKPLEPDQTPEPISAAEAGLPSKAEPAEADSSHFAELAAFKEMENYPEPEWTGGEEPDFSTGHWAVEPKAQSGMPQSVMEDLPARGVLDPDEIPTIPPSAEDMPQVSEPEPEPLPSQWRKWTRRRLCWRPRLCQPRGKSREGTQPVVITRSRTNKVSGHTKPNRRYRRRQSPRSQNQPGAGRKALLWQDVTDRGHRLPGADDGSGGVRDLQILRHCQNLPAVDELQTAPRNLRPRASSTATATSSMKSSIRMRQAHVRAAGAHFAIIAATIATEDKEYYNHPGFDLMRWRARSTPTTPPAKSYLARQRSPSNWRACCFDGRAFCAVLRTQGARDHPGGGNHAPLYQRTGAGTLPQRDFLRKLCLRYRGCRGDLFQHDRG